ncbi:MAG: gliding motility-associated C-terminal domain-containing protein, partial [Bacteroidota bacterium]|nr:gliding motility-associated C-terminal domain-containing protein [Bacteroidota bacterium]
ITVPIDTIPPQAIIQLTGEIRCQNRDFMLDGSGTTPVNITFQWSSILGNILSPTNRDTIQASDVGIYLLEVTRTDNGCRDIDSIVMGEHPDAITQAIIELLRPKCSGDTNAVINVTNVSGGISPILFQLDGGVPQLSTTFGGLTAGTYILQLTDAAGCEYDTSIVIDPTNLFNIDAGPDQEIYLGETITLNGTNDILSSEFFDQVWDSTGIVLCNDCPDFEVRPLETTRYSFTVSSVTGCVKTDDLIIYVIERGKFYIPNIFSPNGDNINEVVRLNPTPGISRVIQWIIFDRWGNAVFGKTDFDPPDPSVFWDGTMNGGETLNPGVFPFMLEIELINGNKELHHGTITLIK